LSIELDIQPAARVIKAADGPTAVRAAALNLNDLADQARQLVLEARKEAARIAAEARHAAEAVKAQALQQGYAEGLARGKEQGLRQAQANADQSRRTESAQLAELAGKIVAELSAARDETLRRARRQMLEFAVELARKIVGQVALADISAARANLEKALKLANGGGEIVVQVNPGQLQELTQQWPELVSGMNLPGEMRLVADEQISPGGVKLLSRSGEIDATIETQLANVAASLLGQAHQPLLIDMFVSESAAAKAVAGA